MSDWQTQDRFVELRCQWLTVIGEHLQDETGKIREYWRVEKADSVVILPIQNRNLILPPPTYRPGVKIINQGLFRLVVTRPHQV